MDLKCYVFEGWKPRIRPASSQREWMDAAPDAFPYRCLPLNIANGHGWEILSPCGFEVEWNGGPAPEDVTVRVDEGAAEHDVPVPLFGLGTFTIHIAGLIRTPPGWNLWVGGPPNGGKDGVSPLAGIIETDWSPYSFTMNWRLTRPGMRVRFAENEAIAHIFPVERGRLEAFAPRFHSIEEEPELKAAFLAWSASRDAFQAHVKANPPEKSADQWQKLYYRGLAPDGSCPVKDHQAKLRAAEFANAAILGEMPDLDAVKPGSAVVAAAAPRAMSDAEWKLAKYEWLFETAARHRVLSPRASGIFRVSGISGEDFLDSFFAPQRPTVLCGAIDDWAALKLWSPAYLKGRIGDAVIACQTGRASNPLFERERHKHLGTMAFDAFIDAAVGSVGNDIYVTANNAETNAEALAPMNADLGALPGILDHAAGDAAGMAWIGPTGSLTPLHHDLTDNLLVQLVGRKRVIIASPAETAKLYNSVDVYSDIPDLTDPGLDLSTFPLLADIRLMDVTLAPGEALFLPVGWWHQVQALDFSVSMTYTNFVWPNMGHETYPERQF